MIFDTLSKDFYSLRQVSGGNINEFGVCLSQQVQILQSEYPGRILPEHMEEMKCDKFCEGLHSKYRWMLAHKVDGKNPAGYSNLLQAAWQLERRADTRDPLPPKTAVTSGLNVTCLQTPGNLLPLHKLKGCHTFTTWAVTIGNNMVEESSSAKQEGEGETEHSPDKEIEVSGRMGGTDEAIEYIIQFAKAVKWYQQKNRSCFGCGSPDHLLWDCSKDISKTAQKADLNTKEGMAKKGSQVPQKPAATQQTSPDKTPQA